MVALILFFEYTATTEISTYCHTLSLHDSLLISRAGCSPAHLHVPSDVSDHLVGCRDAIFRQTPRSRRRPAERRIGQVVIVLERHLERHRHAAEADRKSTRLNSSH